MKPDTTLTLGEFVFAGAEIPEKITFGGDQKLAIHELVGGSRVVDALGRSNIPLEWSGYLMGPTALDRARYLDGLRVVGKPLKLTWSEFGYLVIVQSFQAEYRRKYQLPYRIICIVLDDSTKPVTTIPQPPLDDLVAQDMTLAGGLVSSLGNGALSSAFGALSTAVGAVSSFANAAQSVISPVLQSVNAVRGVTSGLLASVNNTVQNVTTLGGILPNNPISQNVSNLLGQVNSISQLPQLIQLDSLMGRVSNNLTSVYSSARTVTTAGGNLFQLATREYGDPRAWTTIANANGTTDTTIQGVQTLVIPPAPVNPDGVLR